MGRPVFKKPPEPEEGATHYHIANNVRTYAFSWSLSRAQAKVRMDNMEARAKGLSRRSRTFPCRVPDCYVLKKEE